MGNKTIYIKDDELWQRAREFAGKDGLSSAIQTFLVKFVEEAQLANKGFTRHRVAVWRSDLDGIALLGGNRVKYIAFNGRLLHKEVTPDVEGFPHREVAAFETKAGKLVLTLRDIDFEGESVYHYAVHDNLQALGDDAELIRHVPEVSRVNFLDVLSRQLGQEWAVWIE